MNWKSWLLIIAALPLSGSIIWLFSSSVFPEKVDAVSEVVDAPEPVPIERPLVTFVDPSKGSDDPRVTIVEFGNYACSHCREEAKVIERILSEHSDVRFVWKDLPSSLFSGSDIAAEAAQCAKDQGRFWEYQAILFDRNEISNHTSLALIANELDLDLDRFGTCFSGRDKKHLVERSVTEAEALGIDGTPYLFINDRPYSGYLSYDQLEAIISAL